jgi:hypothetical protein
MPDLLPEVPPDGGSLMGYVWKGAQPTEAAPPEPSAFTGGHGTPYGYSSHFRAGDRGDQICTLCREARAAKRREARAAKGLKPGRKPIYGTGCGSPAGYTTHLRRGERPCDDCRTAYNARKREYIASRKAAA